MLSPHALQASSHWEYYILVENTWEIRYLKEMGTKRDKLSVDYMYSSKRFLHKNKVIFKNPPPPPIFYDNIRNKVCTPQTDDTDKDQQQQKRRYRYVKKDREIPNKNSHVK